MRTPQTDGLLLVDKPVGFTSHDVVAVCRRALDEARIGHAGTLDPFATGLLVLLLGRATRLLPYLDHEPKVYDATIKFGAETDTIDHTGTVTGVAPLPSRSAVEQGMTQLTGEIDQIPPAYSAKQVDGQRAYAAARRGETLTLAPVRINVHSWTARAWRDDEVDVTVSCGGGTYVRSLARDLGRLAGSAAHLTVLRRMRSGPFAVDQAQSLDDIRAGHAVIRRPVDAIPALPQQLLDDVERSRIVHGQMVGATVPGARVALVQGDGELVAIGERRENQWQPKVVLGDA